MPLHDTDIKMIYNNVASVIMDLSLNKKISENEMLFLLNLLELVWNEDKLNKGNEIFINTLIQWQTSSVSTDINEIIKQTLISLDFSDEQAWANTTSMMQDLLSSPNNEK